MEETLFLKAENLQDQIQFLKTCLNLYLKKDGAAICISYPVAKQYFASSNMCTDNVRIELPIEIQETMKLLLQDKLNKLKKEFNEL